MDWAVKHEQRPFILGHRGASADAPENTLAAFALAREQGADGIEFDVQLSKDGHIVVFHDQTVDRVTDGEGKVSDLTLAEIQSLTMVDEQRVPTLDEVFELLGPAFLYNVELKHFGWGNAALETAVADRIESHNLEAQTVVSSFNPLAVRRMRQQISQQTRVAHLWYVKRLRYKYVLSKAEAHHPHYSLVDEAYVRWAKSKNWMINVWTVDDPNEARRLTELGVDAIITNKPQYILEHLDMDSS